MTTPYSTSSDHFRLQQVQDKAKLIATNELNDIYKRIHKSTIDQLEMEFLQGGPYSSDNESAGEESVLAFRIRQTLLSVLNDMRRTPATAPKWDFRTNRDHPRPPNAAAAGLSIFKDTSTNLNSLSSSGNPPASLSNSYQIQVLDVPGPVTNETSNKAKKNESTKGSKVTSSKSTSNQQSNNRFKPSWDSNFKLNYNLNFTGPLDDLRRQEPVWSTIRNDDEWVYDDESRRRYRYDDLVKMGRAKSIETSRTMAGIKRKQQDYKMTHKGMNLNDENLSLDLDNNNDRSRSGSRSRRSSATTRTGRKALTPKFSKKSRKSQSGSRNSSVGGGSGSPMGSYYSGGSRSPAQAATRGSSRSGSTSKRNPNGVKMNSSGTRSSSSITRNSKGGRV